MTAATMPNDESPVLAARLRSFVYALRGVRTLIFSQPNARIHALATLLAVGVGLAADLGRLEWALVILAIVGVWGAEALNTALELLCDVASPDFHPLVEKAKDIAAGAVLMAALGAAVLGVLVFGPYCVAWLS